MSRIFTHITFGDLIQISLAGTIFSTPYDIAIKET